MHEHQPTAPLEHRIAYSPTEAAEALGVTRQTIYALIGRRELRRFKVGRCTRIPVSDVLGLVGGPDGNDAPAA